MRDLIKIKEFSMIKAKDNAMFRFLVILAICSSLGFQTWRTLFNNFAVETVGLDGHHIGIIQSVREIPGFLALLAIFILLLIKEHRLSALSVLVLGLGIALTGLLPSFPGVIITTLIMSFGFHYYETVNQSLTLQYFDQNTAPWVLGKIRSLGAASNIVVGVWIYFMEMLLSYQDIFLIIGGILMITAAWALFQDPTQKDIVPQHKKMIFRKRYSLYYILTFLAGARRQIFVAFAVFLMVKKFQFSLQDVTILFVINNVINFFLSPLIGKGIIRFGERKILSVEYFSLIFVFLAYTVVDTKLLVAVLYIFDHIFFNCSIAIKTYFQKTADPKDIAPSMAMGFTINHIAAVVLPVVGGFLWIVDYRIPFIVGAGLSFISLLAIQKIKT